MREVVLLGWVLSGFLLGCGSPPRVRQPLHWQWVEVRYGEGSDRGRTGHGRVDPRATRLVRLPLYAEDLRTEIVVRGAPDPGLVISLSHKQASVGEEVTADVRLRDPDPEGVYRLRATGTGGCVEVLGAEAVVVRGAAAARFRFTSRHPGRAGVEVEVERLD